MKTYETVEFKVGETTFKTMFRINLPYNYGEPVPECHSHCPISVFFYASVSTIINFINRGLRVNLEHEEDAEKIYFFLTEYNKQARIYNKSIGEEANPLAEDAENFFLLKVKHKISKEDTIEEEENKNPFINTVVPKPRNSFRTPNGIQNTFKLSKKKQTKEKLDNRAPEEHKMYEMFNSPSLVSPDGTVVQNPSLEESMLNTMPLSQYDKDLDSMSFGDE
jgi:hypothetical protein